MRHINLIASLLLSVSLYGQIEVQTNFKPNINKPIDDRQQIATLADTSTIAFVYDGLVTKVQDIDERYEYDGTKWVPFTVGSPSGDLHLTPSLDTASTGIAIFNFNVQEWHNTYALPEGSVIATDTLTAPLYISDAACPCNPGEYYRLANNNIYGWPLGTLRKKEE